MTSMLVAVKDSLSSRAVIDYLSTFSFRTDLLTVTLLHVFRQPSSSELASELLLGGDWFEASSKKATAILEDARQMLMAAGIDDNAIQIRLVTEPYPTIGDGIIDQFNQGEYDLVVIGRRKKSKSEEFVLGDASVKLIRALENAAILVVQS